MTTPAPITVEQSRDADGSFEAVITLPGPHTITVTVYAAAGEAHCVGYVYPPEEHTDGQIHDESEPCGAFDTDSI